VIDAATAAAALDEALRAYDPDEAARRFCAAHGLSREPCRTDWKAILAPPAGRPILLLGAGFGDDALALASVAPVTAAVHDRTVAEMLERRLATAARAGVTVLEVADATQLPCADGTLGAVALDTSVAPAFGLTASTSDRFAATLARVLAPGGVACLGVANPIRRLGFDRVGATLQRRHVARPLDRVLGAGGTGAPPGYRALSAAMVRAGFAPPVQWAPLPDERRPQIVLPLAAPAVVRYFLDHLVRKNAGLVGAAIVGARAALRAGLFPALVPYRYLIYTR
jgi:SAM-dependent methyltransferase